MKSEIHSTRLWTLVCGVVLASATLFSTQFVAAAADSTAKIIVSRTPVILDTDIGDDIDDTWALGLLLKSPELDVKLIVGDQGKAQYRAALIAKFLERTKHSDIPVGIGLEVNAKGGGPQSEWVEGYDLKSYPGRVYADGVQAMIDIIMASSKPVALIGIGPVPNLAAALKKEPRIAERVKFFGMHGSVRRGYGNSTTTSAEYNVKADVKACQSVFTAAWPMTITPLDTCGLVVLKGDVYQKFTASADPVAKAVLENYRIWCAHHEDKNVRDLHANQSSTLFDTVAVYLAMTERLLKVETLGIRVNDEGFTVIDESAKKMRVATEWTDLDAFNQFLVQRLTLP
jgi:inosine-uridine nucleoside N-ribohydrolase